MAMCLGRQKYNTNNIGMLGIQAAYFSKIVYLMLLPHPLGIVLAKTYTFLFILFSSGTFTKLTCTIRTKSHFKAVGRIKQIQKVNVPLQKIVE